MTLQAALIFLLLQKPVVASSLQCEPPASLVHSIQKGKLMRLNAFYSLIPCLCFVLAAQQK